MPPNPWCSTRQAARAVRNVTERHTHHISDSSDSENPHLLQSWLEHFPFQLLLSISWHTHLFIKDGGLGDNPCDKPALNVLSPGLEEPEVCSVLFGNWATSSLVFSCCSLNQEEFGWSQELNCCLQLEFYLGLYVVFFTFFVGSISCEVPVLNKALTAQTIYFSHFP